VDGAGFWIESCETGSDGVSEVEGFANMALGQSNV